MTRVERLQALHPHLIGREATGGLERAATGQLAKTDAVAARALAHCAAGIRPTPRPLPDAQTQARRAL